MADDDPKSRVDPIAPSGKDGRHPQSGMDMTRRRFAAWFEADPRALGLFRIFFGLLCLWDVARRVPYITLFYSNKGVLTNHYGLFRQPSEYVFSLMYNLSRPNEVAIFFGFTAICLIFYTLGLYTRVFQFLVAICMWSIHGRNTIIENGGDVVLNIWLLWTLFLPLGRRFSLDALRLGLRNESEPDAAALNARERDTRPVWSLAMFAVLCQLSVIYFFNTVHKGGRTWQDGTALAWVLEQDRIATPFGQWVQDALPMAFTQALSWGTLVIEGIAPLLLLTPFAVVWSRRAAILLLSGLHLGIFLMTDVGLFSPTMMVSYLLLLTPRDFDALSRGLRRLAGPPLEATYDGGVALLHRFARLGARLDALGMVRWTQAQADGPQPGAGAAFVLTEPSTGRAFTGADAVARFAAALPLGRTWAWALAIPGPKHAVGAVLRRLTRDRAALEVEYDLPARDALPPAPPPTPAALRRRRLGFLAAQAIAATFMVALTSQVLIENRFVRSRIAVPQPQWCKALVQYGRFFQGWGMFAPNAPMSDGWIVIDAELADGRHVDPQTGREPVFGPATYGQMDWDQFWGSYSMRIASGGSAHHRQALIDWLRAPVRHLKLPASEKIVAFKVEWIGDRIEDIRGDRTPKVFERYTVVEWPSRRGR